MIHAASHAPVPSQWPADAIAIALDLDLAREIAAQNAERALLTVAGQRDQIATLICVGRVCVDHQLTAMTRLSGCSEPDLVAHWRAVVIAAFVRRALDLIPHMADAPGIWITQ